MQYLIDQKMTVKTFMMLEIILFLGKKTIMVFTKILSSTTVFNIDSKKFIEHQISILEWFLKDDVTLFTFFKWSHGEH